MKEFREFGLKPELLAALDRIGFRSATEVQEQAIPMLLQGKDVIVRSKTGSGKTGAFLVPILQMLERKGHPQALVLLPTRELALQVTSVAKRLSHGGLRVVVVYGGASINVQMDELSRGADLVIGTPGRVIDLMDRGALRLQGVKFMVLDEADLMLDMGFIEDVELIMSMTPKERQTMLFSATMPREIIDISRKHMRHDAVRLTVGEEEKLTVETITHNYFIANGRFKFAALLAYIDHFKPAKCIIFSSTQRESEFIFQFLRENGMDVILMHGGLTQAKREHSLREFREHARFLISTNLAARGLDIPDVTDIINFDAPDEPKTYVHRVGRSARMGKDGRAFTIFGYEQKDLMQATMRIANVRMHHIHLETDRYRNVQLPERTRGDRRRSFHQRERTGDRNFRGHRPGSGRYGGRDGRREGGGYGGRRGGYRPRQG